MKKEDFDVINDYLNNLSLYMFECKDVEDNYDFLIRMNNCFSNYFGDRYFVDGSSQIVPRKNNLTYEDVLNISRKVIESINPKYLEEFDKLLNSGIIDFGYEDEYEYSFVRHVFSKGKLESRIINLKRSFNYNDIETLVHEFMHYVCFVGDGMRNKIIGEMISIYFELYTMEYLKKNYNFELEELFYNRRLVSIYRHSGELKKIELLLYLYMNFGNLDENSYKYAAGNYKDYSKEDYESECKKTLEIIKKIKDGTYEKNVVEESHYYLYATLLAFYFRKKVSLEKMLNFVDNVKNVENEDLGLIELLNKYNLKIEDNVGEVLYNSFNEYLDIFEAEKRQR